MRQLPNSAHFASAFRGSEIAGFFDPCQLSAKSGRLTERILTFCIEMCCSSLISEKEGVKRCQGSQAPLDSFFFSGDFAMFRDVIGIAKRDA